MNFFHNRRQFSFVNVCFCPVQPYFLLQFQQFPLQLIFLVLLLLEFGVEFLSEEFQGLILFLKDDAFAVDVFHEVLLVIKEFEFFELIFKPDKIRGFPVKLVLSFFGGAGFVDFFEFELLELLFELKFLLDGDLDGELDFFFESFVLLNEVLDVDSVFLKFFGSGFSLLHGVFDCIESDFVLGEFLFGMEEFFGELCDLGEVVGLALFLFS